MVGWQPKVQNGHFIEGRSFFFPPSSQRGQCAAASGAIEEGIEDGRGVGGHHRGHVGLGDPAGDPGEGRWQGSRPRAPTNPLPPPPQPRLQLKIPLSLFLPSLLTHYLPTSSIPLEVALPSLFSILRSEVEYSGVGSDGSLPRPSSRSLPPFPYTALSVSPSVGPEGVRGAEAARDGPDREPPWLKVGQPAIAASLLRLRATPFSPSSVTVQGRQRSLLPSFQSEPLSPPFFAPDQTLPPAERKNLEQLILLLLPPFHLSSLSLYDYFSFPSSTYVLAGRILIRPRPSPEGALPQMKR